MNYYVPAVSLFKTGTFSWLGRNVARLHSTAMLARAFHVGDFKLDPPTHK